VSSPLPLKLLYLPITLHTRPICTPTLPGRSGPGAEIAEDVSWICEFRAGQGNGCVRGFEVPGVCYQGFGAGMGNWRPVRARDHVPTGHLIQRNPEVFIDISAHYDIGEDALTPLLLALVMPLMVAVGKS
jgi:hypothetical protein